MLLTISAVASVTLWAYACGDGTTEPPAPDPLLPTAVTVSPATATVVEGDTLRLTATATNVYGQAVTGVEFVWASGDTAVAVVDASGLVTGVGAGQAQVTAISAGITGRATLTVVAPAPTTVAVTPDTVVLTMVGQTAQLAAEVRDQAGRAMDGIPVAWSSADTTVAVVDSAGLVTAVGGGAVTVAARAGAASGDAHVNVAINPDRAALVALYNATDGPNWINNYNWLSDAPMGTAWFGVKTDASGRVVELNLGRNRLRGTIPPELGSLAHLRHLELASNDLSGGIPPEIGKLTRLTYLNLGPNRLVDPVPPELGNLTNLDWLNLQTNNLQGPLPSALSQLSSLRVLGLQNNNLRGPLPSWLLELDVNLDFLSYEGNDGFCTPGTAAFIQWRQEVDSRGFVLGPLCHEDDIAGLEALYDATAGAGWSDAAGWLEGLVLDDWYGIQTDSTGRVIGLDLSRNGLTGHLPSQLGRLTAATTLRLGDNALSGRLPQSLTALVLREFGYADTGLCTPADASFRKWLNSVPLHNGTGMECAPLSDRDILQTLYDATDGPGWTHSDYWLTDAPLRTWHGVTTNGQGRVVSLSLASNELSGDIPAELGRLTNLQTLQLPTNQLTGSIPPELGNLTSLRGLLLGNNQLTGDIPAELGHLTNLQTLYLERNRLTGSIPPELGNLTNLLQLWLEYNQLTGSIPAELGHLTNLQFLYLGTNRLTGSIPPELGNRNLTNLRGLFLGSNQLTGAIPPQLGNLANLATLYLNGNQLTGMIPPELGKLTMLIHVNLVDNRLTGGISTLGALSELETLRLVNNDLEGPVPPEFGGLTGLRELLLSRNRRMSGALPQSLTALTGLEVFVAEDTELCVPTDGDFLNWLDGIPARRIARCSGSPGMAYVTQAVQSPEFRVALVSNEEALLRVFVTAARSNAEDIPPVRATLYANGAQALVVDVPSKPGPIPTEVREWSLSSSANAGIPVHLVQPGLEIVIEVDPAGTVDPALGVRRRIPETGRLPVDVRAMPLFDLTVIPFLWSESADSSILEITAGLNADSDLLFETRTLLPVGDFEVTVHAPVSSSSNDPYVLFTETSAIRVMEGGSGHYMGTMAQLPVTAPRGLGSLPGRISFSIPEGWIMAHELGHNMSLLHPWQNPVFPSYPNGTIGAWGYDFRRGGHLVRPDAHDIMVGCCWISDFHFDQALRFREADAGGVGATPATGAMAVKSLLLWGGMGADSVAFLEPAFVVDAPPSLPASGGDHRITGTAADGSLLFSLDFAMPATVDGDGSSSFAFTLPVRAGWEGSLATITLIGPKGSVTLDGESDIPMAILRDPRTGQVRGILRDPSQATEVAADAAGAIAPGLEVLFSRGIPEASAWRR